MPGESITLKPNQGASLAITGALRLDVEGPDWGDQEIDASLAEGVDVIGAIPGARQRRSTEAVIPLRIKADTATAYIAAANSLNDAWQALARFGGLVERQVEFPDGTTVAAETEVTQAHLDPEDGWLQAHRLTSLVTLTLTRQPYWLTDEELVAQLTANTDDVRELNLTALSGNLPGPARLRIEDTTNRIANSSFETDTAGWTQSGTGTTLTRVTTESYLGVASLEVDTDGTAADQGAVTVPSLDAAASTRHTAVAWVKAPAGAQRKIILQERDASDAFVDNVTVTFTGTGDWQRVEVANTFGATGTKARVLITTNGTFDATFHVDRVMLDAKARRTAFISQNWTHPSEQILFLGNDTASDPGQGTVVGTTVELSPVAPAWQTVYALDDLAHRGSFKVRTRSEWAASEQITMRCLYRIGNGSWREAAKPVVLPTSSPAEAWEIDLGSVHHHSDGSLDLRVQVYADAVNATDDFVFCHLTVEPTEGYAVARGIAVEDLGSGGLEAFDAFDHDDGLALTGTDDSLANTWAGFGSATDFEIDATNERIERGGVADANVDSGRLVLVGGVLTNVRVEIPRMAASFSGLALNHHVLGGIVARGTDASNFLVAYLQVTIAGDGGIRYFLRLKKYVTGTSTLLFERSRSGLLSAPLHTDFGAGGLTLSVDTAGNWELTAGPEDALDLGAVTTFTGQDSTLATAGALDDGRAGVYAAQTEIGWDVELDGPFTVYDAATSSVPTAVVREDGIGEFSISGGRRKAITAETDDTLPAPVPSYQGSGLWLPPGDSRLALRLHPNDLDQEPATDDYDGSVDVALYRRAAWVTLPDSLDPLTTTLEELVLE